LEIITVDLPKLAQLKQGHKFRFKMVEYDLAEQLFLEQQQLLKTRAWACYFKWKK
jgi:allophanate hydrolase subunit 2